MCQRTSVKSFFSPVITSSLADKAYDIFENVNYRYTSQFSTCTQQTTQRCVCVMLHMEHMTCPGTINALLFLESADSWFGQHMLVNNSTLSLLCTFVFPTGVFLLQELYRLTSHSCCLDIIAKGDTHFHFLSLGATFA